MGLSIPYHSNTPLLSRSFGFNITPHYMSIPIINIEDLIAQNMNQTKVALEIRKACMDNGFFYIVGHGVSENLQNQLESLSHQFFAQPESVKMQIKMALGGKAWRGYFPVGNELTSGKPDLKEGIYFGTELDDIHSKVQAGLPMHGRNLFPVDMLDFKTTVLEYINVLTTLGHHLMRGLSLSLGFEETYFNQHFTNDPLCLFRIFHYPPSKKQQETPEWGVGEHTDYGLLTILKQDNVGGLQIKSKSEWIEAPVVPNSFVCNIGDMAATAAAESGKPVWVAWSLAEKPGDDGTARLSRPCARALRAVAGWRLMTVPYFEWEELHDSISRRGYLVQKLRECESARLPL